MNLIWRDIPGNARARLEDDKREDFWEQVYSEMGSIEEELGYQRSKIYNWKSKGLAVPVEVYSFLGYGVEDLSFLKSSSSSHGLKPGRVDEGILTRVKASSVLDNGSPVYYSSSIQVVDNFLEKIAEAGADYSFYRRDGFYIRFPRILYDLAKKAGFDRDLTAAFDEKGVFKSGNPFLEGKVLDPADLRIEDIWRPEKKYRVAILSGESGELEKILGEESEKVRRMFS